MSGTVAVTLDDRLSRLPLAAKLQLLFSMLDDVISGRDETLDALRRRAEEVAAPMVIVGGIAVIRHGYERTTKDRDVLVSYRHARLLADHLMDQADWERLEIRQYCFLYRPTGVQVDFLVSRDLIELGRPYLFPELDEIETAGPVAGIPVIGLHDLLWLKLLAGRMQDLADAMQLCKLHLGSIDRQRVLRLLQPEDDDVRERFDELLRQAPIELENERRLGQGIGGRAQTGDPKENKSDQQP